MNENQVIQLLYLLEEISIRLHKITQQLETLTQDGLKVENVQ